MCSAVCKVVLGDGVDAVAVPSGALLHLLGRLNVDRFSGGWPPIQKRVSLRSVCRANQFVLGSSSVARSGVCVSRFVCDGCLAWWR